MYGPLLIYKMVSKVNKGPISLRVRSIWEVNKMNEKCRDLCGILYLDTSIPEESDEYDNKFYNITGRKREREGPKKEDAFL